MAFLEEDESMQMLEEQNFHECEAPENINGTNVYCQICNIKLHPLYPLVTYHRSKKYKNSKCSQETLAMMDLMHQRQNTNRVYIPEHKHGQFRSAIIGYIRELSAKLEYSQQTLHLAISIMDLVLGEYSFDNNKISFICIIVLMISAKMNELNYKIPNVEDIIDKLNNRFTVDEYINYELTIFVKVLNLSADIQTPYRFIERFMYHGILSNNEVGLDVLEKNISLQLIEFFQEIVETLTEHTLDHYQLYKYNSSTIAAAVIMKARQIFGTEELWNQHLVDLTSEEEESVRQCMNEFSTLLKKDRSFMINLKKIHNQKQSLEKKIKDHLINNKILYCSNENELFNCSIAQLLKKVQIMQEHQEKMNGVTFMTKGSNLLHQEIECEEENSPRGILFKKT